MSHNQITKSIIYPTFYKNRKTRKVGNNTYAIYNEEFDYVQVTLHGNVIAVIEGIKNPEINKVYRIVSISDCGWSTVTTRNRINSVLSALDIKFRVGQTKHEQVLRYRDENGQFTEMKIPSQRFGYYSQHNVTFYQDTIDSEYRFEV